MGIGNPVIISVSTHIPLISTDAHEDSSYENEIQTSSLSEASKELCPSFKGNATQNAGLPEFSTREGRLQISTLTHHDDVGAIVHRTLCADGTMTNKVVTRIPKCSTFETCYSTIVQAEDDTNHRLVLNMAAQQSYSLDQGADFQLPAVIGRVESTIPTHTTHIKPLHIIQGDVSGKRELKREDDGLGDSYALVKRPRRS